MTGIVGDPTTTVPAAGPAEGVGSPAEPGPGLRKGGGSPGRRPWRRPLAVLVVRGGEPPLGADEAVAEAGGHVILAGDGTRQAAEQLTAAQCAWTLETPPGLQVSALARRLHDTLLDSPLVVLPGSPDGRDLAPRLAFDLDRPLLAGATLVGVAESPGGKVEVAALLARLDDRLSLPVRMPAPAVATLALGVRSVAPARGPVTISELDAPDPLAGAEEPEPRDVEVLAVLEPDAETMDLAEAPRVVAGGAGLVPAGAGEAAGRAVFEVLTQVAAALGASAGATRVVTDAGWMSFERQIGTTGVVLDPDLYIAIGISGAVQHIGGIGTPAHVISVNTDASCPMTAAAELGMVTDARALLAELAHRLGVAVPPEAELPPVSTPMDRTRSDSLEVKA
ncbi:MAG TPA: mycofactocin-associated electron transfer flavoprotein alpha subunit [Dermatophilaceae bacterium]|nr:mycofactocin-associated electron transfer flavoprotein alpha subunit [Dermatophilaceae bacterium]